MTNKCEYCGKEFKRESSLITHMCNKKKRWLWKDEKFVVMGFISFKKFYEFSYRSSKEKTYLEFMNSKYYDDFVKFGKHILDINAIDPEGFVIFLIKANVPLKNWTSEWAYEGWVRELGKKESPERALERNILLMQKWALEYNEQWFDFFRKISPSLATKWIKSGRISPWLLYTVGQPLLNRMSDEQLGLVKENIDPSFWFKKIESYKDEINDIKSVLKEYGI